MKIGTRPLSGIVYRVTTNLPGWKEKRSRSVVGLLKDVNNMASWNRTLQVKGLSINGNLKFTISVCISARFRILKYVFVVPT